MTDKSADNINKNIDQEGVRKELDELVQSKLQQLDEKLDAQAFEEEFREKAQELEKEKEAHYQRKGKRRSEASGSDSEHRRVYAAASAAARKLASYRPVGEGFLHRTWRLGKQLKAKRREMQGKDWYTQERRQAEYAACVDDCWGPVVDGWDGLWNTAWNFICRLGEDLWDLILIVADAVIAAVYYLGSFFYYIWDRLWDVRYWIEQRKHNIFAAFAVLVVVIAASVVLIQSSTAYEYSYHGKLLGTARSVDDVYRTIDVLGDKLSKATGANVSLDVERDMTFNKVVGFNLDVDTDEDILNTITYMKDLQVEAYVICVDDEETVTLESESVAKELLSEIQNEYAAASTGAVIDEVSYDQKVEIRPSYCLLGDIWNRSDAKKVLQGNKEGTDEPLITIRSTETATYTEAVAYDVQYIDNASLYEGETEIKSQGSEGTDLIVATVERVNGQEVARTVVSTTRITEPVAEVQYRGTKPIPATQGTGAFQYPLASYTISSYFGMRWGTLHTGVDLAAPMGSKIYASDGGTVTFAGWKGSYGYLVIISHGGLFETYYAHCSKILVSVGENVYQGQNIALVGSTGYSTGPHCHFEVRYNGTPNNPLNYL
ncbi:MAG: peptidoglycan DD-metalloendopeptidase family protein [Firmicutes bacterium]|nr:peptidoglycan DD-metalloendopeptidase family protein [Bacillota bacterium]MBR3719424.1 peptidoglycan DD-metalloendopeptidase family protein [Bacillota bacterium]